jgi:hypothetical protein
LGGTPTGRRYSSGERDAAPPPKLPGSDYDAEAAQARQREESRQRYLKGQQPKPTSTDPGGNVRRLDPQNQRTRTVREQLDPEARANRERRREEFYGERYRESRPGPVVPRYPDAIDDVFWWWLLQQDRDRRARWAYHHRETMSDERYRDLLARDQELAERIRQLEAEGVPRDPSYRPGGIDPDLMYDDRYVEAADTPQPPPARTGRTAVIIFVVLAVTTLAIWLVFFKRWGGGTRPVSAADRLAAAGR